MIKNNEGVITIKILIIFTSILFLFAVLFDILLVSYGKNRIIRDQLYQLDSKLAAYNTYLYANYGLYGISSTTISKPEKVSKTNLVSFTNYTQDLRGGKSLHDKSVLKEQVLTFMKYRLPINYGDQLLSKLEVIKKSSASNDILDLKTIADEELSKLESLVINKRLYASKINALDIVKLKALILNLNGDLSFLHEKYDDAYKHYVSSKSTLNKTNHAYILLEKALVNDVYKGEALMDQLNNKKKELDLDRKDFKIQKNRLRAVEEKVEDLFGELKALSEILEENRRFNSTFVENVKTLADQSQQVFSSIDHTLKSLEMNQDKVLIEISTYVKEQLKKSKHLVEDQLKDVQYGLAFDNEKNYTREKNKEKSILYLSNKNIEILDHLIGQVDFKNKNTFKARLRLRGMAIKSEALGDYFKAHQVKMHEDKKIDEDLNNYYKRWTQTQGDYDFDPGESKKIPANFNTNGSSKGINFWTVVKIMDESVKKLYENISINEYIVSTFNSAAKKSTTDFNFFNKYERARYFYRGEIEYILFGHKDEQVNLLKTSMTIFNVRTIMNGLHLYTDKKKLALSESIGVAVAGWTGFGAPVVSNAIRLSWAVSESMIDMKNLYNGACVPFYKVYADQWALDLGLPVGQNNKTANVKMYDFSYHDYLRFMLLVVAETNKLDRVGDLVALNLMAANKLFDLGQYHTTVEIKSYAEVNTLFIDFDIFNKIQQVFEMSY